MSDYQDRDIFSSKGSVSSKLHVCLFCSQQQFTQTITELLDSDRYELKYLNLAEELFDFTTQNREQIDCIVLVNEAEVDSILERLWHSKTLLPTVIIETEQPNQTVVNSQSAPDLAKISSFNTLYHQAEIHLYPTQLKEIDSYIKLAITKFLNLAPDSKVDYQLRCQLEEEGVRNSLLNQQRRLTEKIQERLGYLGVYYKRNRSQFYHNLPLEQQKKLDRKLSLSYRKILLNYFNDSSQINKLIDDFVDRAFFINVSTSQILEIHMELIDEFSQQLRIEGRSDDILLDYRLPLIDIIAHLCEMYRRSIPGDDISLELLFGVK